MSEISVDTLAQALRSALQPNKSEQLHLQERPEGRPHERIHCTSPSGATFVAVVASSNTYPDHGRVKNLEDYKYPERYEFPKGGQWHKPDAEKDGILRLKDLTALGKQHLADNTWQLDLKTYVGHQFDWRIRTDKQAEIQAATAKMNAELGAKVEAMAPAPAAVAKSK